MRYNVQVTDQHSHQALFLVDLPFFVNHSDHENTYWQTVDNTLTQFRTGKCGSSSFESGMSRTSLNIQLHVWGGDAWYQAIELYEMFGVQLLNKSGAGWIYQWAHNRTGDELVDWVIID